MVNNNLNINLNSTVPLNSINHKSNQQQQDGVVMVEMKVLVMEMMMMILMKSGVMVMMMATISPLREGNSLADSCLLESFSLCGVFRPAEAVVSISEPPPFT
jgi:hypothetical protein